MGWGTWLVMTKMYYALLAEKKYIGKYELIECPGAINGQFGAGLSQEPHPATPSTKFVP